MLLCEPQNTLATDSSSIFILKLIFILAFSSISVNCNICYVKIISAQLPFSPYFTFNLKVSGLIHTLLCSHKVI